VVAEAGSGQHQAGLGDIDTIVDFGGGHDFSGG
jgi:hypothetical protein